MKFSEGAYVKLKKKYHIGYGGFGKKEPTIGVIAQKGTNGDGTIVRFFNWHDGHDGTGFSLSRDDHSHWWCPYEYLIPITKKQAFIEMCKL